MNEALWISIIRNLIIPEVTSFMQRHHGDTGQLPTDAEVIANLNLDADHLIAEGEAWLAEHPPEA